MSFDPEDKDSWYFEDLNREQANEVIKSEKQNGTFLVRASQTIIGDMVLCVQENDKISHYIINRVENGGVVRYKIGDQDFPSLPALLRFYQHHFLDQSNLVKPVPMRVIAKYDFGGRVSEQKSRIESTEGDYTKWQRYKYALSTKRTSQVADLSAIGGRDPEDLPFKKGEVLTIVRKDEEEWWTAKNVDGKEGLIPVPYVEKYTPQAYARYTKQASRRTEPTKSQPRPQEYHQPDVPKVQRTLPAFAKVTRSKYPTPHNPSQLRLQVGDIVKVLATNISGEWEGEIDGKRGFFPFTHVEFVDTEKDEG